MKLVAFFKGYNVDKFHWSMFWVFLKLFLFGFVAAIFDIVHDVEAIFRIPQLLTGFFLNYE